MATFPGCPNCGRPSIYCICHSRNYPPVYGLEQLQAFEQESVSSKIEKEVESRVQERLKIADKPVLTDCFIGYRVWYYNAGYLQSAFKTQYNWPHRKALTKDVYDSAGIHAVKESKGVIPLLAAYCWDTKNPFETSKKPTRGIAGAVYLWGEVVEHTAGYLAEFAYPKELFVDESCDVLTIMQLEGNYGVPVSIRAELNPPTNSIDKGLIGRWVSYKVSYSVQGPPTPGTVKP